MEYYARIEQARGPHPSPRILNALAGALRLTPAERIHLFRLAGASPAPPPGPCQSARVLRHLLRRAGSAAEQLAERGDLAMQAGAGHGVG